MRLRRAHQLQHRRQSQAALARKSRRFQFGALVVAGAGKADAHLVAAKDRMLAFCRRMLLIEDLALPAAMRRCVAAKVVEESIAAENAAVMEQHHAGKTAVDAVEYPDVNGVKPVDDAALADR